MPDSIVIKAVRLLDMDVDQLTRAMRRSKARWYVLSVTVKNVSDAAPMYVMTDVRKIDYDAGRRVLLVQFSERDVPAVPDPGRIPAPPKYVAVRPGAEAAFTHQLASPITFIEETADGARRANFVRITEDVDTIECTVSYDTDPPPPAGDLTSRSLRTRWGDWGTAVQFSLNLSANAERSH